MIVLYSTGCTKCSILKKKLDMSGRTYTTITDADEMIKMGFTSAPMLDVDGKIMNFDDAIRWLS